VETDQLQFPVLCRRPAGDPAFAARGRGHRRRQPRRHASGPSLPAAGADDVLPAGRQHVYALFDTFGIIHAVTGGGPGKATETLVYKVYNDGFVNLIMGDSAAQSVILMVIVIALTAFQFRFIERKVHYG
jgi:hypothetical protein